MSGVRPGPSGVVILLLAALTAPAWAQTPEEEPARTDEAVVMAPSALSVTGIKEDYKADEAIELVLKVPRQNVLRARAEVVLMHEDLAGQPIYQDLRDYDRFSDVQQLRFTLAPPAAERRGKLALLVRVRGLRTDRAGEAAHFEEALTYRVRYAEGGAAQMAAGQRLEGRILFAIDSAVVGDKARAQVKAWAASIKGLDTLAEVRVEGHADQLGRQNYNLALSRRRAEAVRDVLIAEGVPGHLVKVIGFGFSRPATDRAPIPGERGVRENRRAEVVWFEARPKETP